MQRKKGKERVFIDKNKLKRKQSQNKKVKLLAEMIEEILVQCRNLYGSFKIRLRKP